MIFISGKYNGNACVPTHDIRPMYCIITFPAATRGEAMCLQLISQGLETAMPDLATKWQSTHRVSLKSSSTENKLQEPAKVQYGRSARKLYSSR